jgi:succinoglycan biosynthesis transport protein ExoP
MISDIKFYLSLLLRRFHYFLIIMVAVTAVGVTMAYTLPPVYEAEARLLVESPQIPDKLAASTVGAESTELLQIIRQRILTRNNLLDLARRHKVQKSGTNLNPDAIVRDMQKRIIVKLPGNRDRALFVSVSFKAPTAAMSAGVTNDLVTQILQENVAFRTAVTGQTLDFFRQEVARLDGELARQGDKILQFKLKNKNALPDSMDYRRARQSSLQERLLQIERDLAALRDRRTRLVTLFERTGNVDLAGQTLTSEQRRLQALEAELSSALVIYSEQNPRVVSLKTQIESLKTLIAGQSETSSPGGEKLSVYDVQLADLDGQIVFTEQQTAAIEVELAALVVSIEATPTNAVTLGTLERDYENIRIQYNRATADFAAARTGDQIEAQSRGQRISVIEQAVEPREPTSPDRKRISILSLGAGLFLGVAFVALLELMNGAIRRPSEISTKLGITPFATIPFIQTKTQRTRRRLIIGGALLLVAVGIPLTLYLLHVYYLPMDMLVERALDKSGLSGLIDQFR